jgi:hypothetical protein
MALVVKFMEQPMNDRRENDARGHDHRQTAVESVEPGEEFATPGLQSTRGAHTGQDHRGVQKRIDPFHSLQVVIAAHAAEQGESDEADRQDDAPTQPSGKSQAAERRLMFVLKSEKMPTRQTGLLWEGSIASGLGPYAGAWICSRISGDASRVPRHLGYLLQPRK